MARLTSSQFMHTLPTATREHLPVSLRRFKSSSRGWLCQLYYREAPLHYEVWNLGERWGLLEIGLHFESKNRATNLALLNGFTRHMVEVKATLGPQWEAEMWDRGWTKVYETVPYVPFSTEVLADVAQRLARTITILQPIWDSLPKT